MKNYNTSNIQNWLFFDIEVVREFKTFKDLAANRNAELWKKANNKYYVDHIAEFGDNDIDEVCYEKNAAFFPEQGKVISVAFGKFKAEINGDDLELKKAVIDISMDDEKLLLSKVADLINRNYIDSNSQLCGFNIIEFDIPYLMKRMIKNDVKVPKMLIDLVSAKPWDMKAVDVMRDWKFNSMKNTSLGTLQEFLGIESSKEGEINGMNLGEKYWACANQTERNAFVKKVGFYAQGDVSSLMDIVVKLCHI